MSSNWTRSTGRQNCGVKSSQGTTSLGCSKFGNKADIVQKACSLFQVGVVRFLSRRPVELSSLGSVKQIKQDSRQQCHCNEKHFDMQPASPHTEHSRPCHRTGTSPLKLLVKHTFIGKCFLLAVPVLGCFCQRNNLQTLLMPKRT